MGSSLYLAQLKNESVKLKIGQYTKVPKLKHKGKKRVDWGVEIKIGHLRTGLTSNGLTYVKLELQKQLIRDSSENINQDKCQKQLKTQIDKTHK